jgi:GIY-YIG catalytic domain
MTKIYSLVCPLSKTVRYIGKTNDTGKRLRGHLAAAKAGVKNHQANWLRRVLGAGEVPKLKVIFHVPSDMSWEVAERFFIAAGRHFGFRLTNVFAGGEGADSVAMKAVHGRPGQREKYVAGLKAAWADPAVRAKHEAAQTPELRALYSERSKEVNNRPGMRERKSEACKRTKGTPEARADAVAKAIASRTPRVRKIISKTSQGTVEGQGVPGADQRQHQVRRRRSLGGPCEACRAVGQVVWDLVCPGQAGAVRQDVGEAERRQPQNQQEA